MEESPVKVGLKNCLPCIHYDEFQNNIETSDLLTVLPQKSRNLITKTLDGVKLERTLNNAESTGLTSTTNLTQDLNTKMKSKPKKKKTKNMKKKLTVNISGTKYSLIKKIADKLKYKCSKEEDGEWDVAWIDSGVHPEKLHKMQGYQKINHFPGTSSITRKNKLGRNLMKLLRMFPTEYNFFPQTWLIPYDLSDIRSSHQKNKNRIYIVKPEGSSQGKGIFLVKDPQEIPNDGHLIVQEYIQDPLLIENLKFDLRIYVLLGSIEPLRIFIHSQGLARFSTEPYIKPKHSNLSNVFMHLTNYSINKHHRGFIFNQKGEEADYGHKRNLQHIWDLIDKMQNSPNASKAIRADIDDLVVKTICGVQPGMAHIYKTCRGYTPNKLDSLCFEVLGFDILINNQLKPILIEVNHSPSFSTDTPFDMKVKSAVISDTFRLLNMKYKNKQKYKTAAKLQLQKRVLWGKGSSRFTLDEQTKSPEQLLLQKSKEEKKNMGGYRLIYPPVEEEGVKLTHTEYFYEQFMNYSRESWEAFTGISKKRGSTPLLPSKKGLGLNQSRGSTSSSQNHRGGLGPTDIENSEFEGVSRHQRISSTIKNMTEIEERNSISSKHKGKEPRIGYKMGIMETPLNLQMYAAPLKNKYSQIAMQPKFSSHQCAFTKSAKYKIIKGNKEKGFGGSEERGHVCALENKGNIIYVEDMTEESESRDSKYFFEDLNRIGEQPGLDKRNMYTHHLTPGANKIQYSTHVPPYIFSPEKKTREVPLLPNPYLLLSSSKETKISKAVQEEKLGISQVKERDVRKKSPGIENGQRNSSEQRSRSVNPKDENKYTPQINKKYMLDRHHYNKLNELWAEACEDTRAREVKSELRYTTTDTLCPNSLYAHANIKKNKGIIRNSTIKYPNIQNNGPPISAVWVSGKNINLLPINKDNNPLKFDVSGSLIHVGGATQQQANRLHKNINNFQVHRLKDIPKPSGMSSQDKLDFSYNLKNNRNEHIEDKFLSTSENKHFSMIEKMMPNTLHCFNID